MPERSSLLCIGVLQTVCTGTRLNIKVANVVVEESWVRIVVERAGNCAVNTVIAICPLKQNKINYFQKFCWMLKIFTHRFMPP